jgi:hypothetical protein
MAPIFLQPRLPKGSTSTLLREEPWVLQIDDFLSAAEARALVDRGQQLGMQPSEVKVATGTHALESASYQRSLHRTGAFTPAYSDWHVHTAFTPA